MSLFPSTQVKPLSLRTHHQLSQMPFTREISARERFKIEDHEQVISRLRQLIENRMSGALIAPAGTGKSVVLRAVAESLPEARYRVRYLHVTSLSKRDFCRELCAAVGCEPAGHYGALVKRLREHWSGLMDQESLRPVVLIDEAHDLRPDVLAILRILTNFEMDSRLVVSILLVGQSRLRQLLRRNELEAVRSRLSYYGSLRLLSRKESREYVRYRCSLAGATEQSLFDDHAHDALFEAAQGNMRALDTLARATLQDAAEANVSVAGVENVIRARQQVCP